MLLAARFDQIVEAWVCFRRGQIVNQTGVGWIHKSRPVRAGVLQSVALRDTKLNCFRLGGFQYGTWITGSPCARPVRSRRACMMFLRSGLNGRRTSQIAGKWKLRRSRFPTAPHAVALLLRRTGRRRSFVNRHALEHGGADAFAFAQLTSSTLLNAVAAPKYQDTSTFAVMAGRMAISHSTRGSKFRRCGIAFELLINLFRMTYRGRDLPPSYAPIMPETLMAV